MTDKQFKGWLYKRIGRDNTPQPFCKVCEKFLACSKTGLKRHLATSLHQNRSATTGNTNTITSLFTKAASQEQSSSMEKNYAHLLLSIIYQYLCQMIC